MKIRFYAMGLGLALIMMLGLGLNEYLALTEAQGDASTSYVNTDVVDTALSRYLELPGCQSIFVKSFVRDVALRSFTLLDERKIELDLKYLEEDPCTSSYCDGLWSWNWLLRPLLYRTCSD